jgi:hypothetical protein
MPLAAVADSITILALESMEVLAVEHLEKLAETQQVVTQHQVKATQVEPIHLVNLEQVAAVEREQ